jgi:uncharacterized protein YkwD
MQQHLAKSPIYGSVPDAFLNELLRHEKHLRHADRQRYLLSNCMAVKKIIAIVIFSSLTWTGLFGPAQESLAASSDEDARLSQLVQTIHQEVNEFRRSHDLKPLTLNTIINSQAQEHSVEMARSGDIISHRGFSGRLKEIRKKISYRAAAENVATNGGYKNPAQKAVEGWKNSPEHRKNMLGDYSLTGIGVARNGRGDYFFTQIFLKP